MVEYTTLQVDVKTRDRLKHYGIKDTTYIEILNKLMDFYDNNNGFDNMRKNRK